MPHTNRSKLQPLSFVLYHIDIGSETLSALIAPLEFATANATAHVIETDSNGEADRILILGGTSKQIALFSSLNLSLRNVTCKWSLVDVNSK